MKRSFLVDWLFFFACLLSIKQEFGSFPINDEHVFRNCKIITKNTVDERGVKISKQYQAIRRGEYRIRSYLVANIVLTYYEIL